MQKGIRTIATQWVMAYPKGDSPFQCLDELEQPVLDKNVYANEENAARAASGILGLTKCW